MELNKINKINLMEYNKLFSTSMNQESQNEVSFGELLKNALENVNKLQVEADNYKKMLVTGQVENIHEVMIAAEKANIALQFTLSIRNKVVEAYREIMRMQI